MLNYNTGDTRGTLKMYICRMLAVARSPAAIVALFLVSIFADCLADQPVRPTGAEAEIRQRAKDYLQAVKHGNGEQIAAFWTPDGDYVDESGQIVKGRQLARQARREQGREAAQAMLTATADTLRFVSPDVAIEDGTVSIKKAVDLESAVKRYTAIWVRREGRWLLDGVRELAASAGPGDHRLRELTWMLGDWQSDDGGKTMRLTCSWSPDQHFLLREIDVNLPDGGPLHVSQRIGWDPRERQIKSWNFDSEGGYGTGLWFQRGNQWTVEAESVMANGSRSTGTNVYSVESDDCLVWQARNAEIDGQPVPDRSLRVIRRKASDQP